MSHSLSELMSTDSDLDLIASRDVELTDDLVLAGLAALARSVDEVPLPRHHLRVQAEPIPQGAPMSRPRKGALAMSATVALMLSSTGVAAAVSGDPMAPLHFVARQVLDIGPRGSGQLPGWDLDGVGRISVIRPSGSDGAVDGWQSSHAQSTTGIREVSLSHIGLSHHERTSDGGGNGGSSRHPHDPGTGSGRGGDGPSKPGRGHGHSPGRVRSPRAPEGGVPTSPVKPAKPVAPRRGHSSSGSLIVTGPGRVGTSHRLAPEPPAKRPSDPTGVRAATSGAGAAPTWPTPARAPLNLPLTGLGTGAATDPVIESTAPAAGS